MRASETGPWTKTAVALAVLGVLASCQRNPAPAPSARQAAATVESPAPCVFFQALRPFLPAELAGFRQIRDEGSTGKYGGDSVSEVERVFEIDEDRQLSVRIVDTTLGKKLGKAIRDAASDGQGRAATDPTAPIATAETVGFVRFDPAEQKAEANLWVGDRFVVAVSSTGFPGTTEVRQVAMSLNLAGLAKLR